MEWFGEIFFAPIDAYKPAGMFTLPHFISLIICLVIVWYALKVTKRLSWESIVKITRLIAIVVTILEGVKIAYNFYYGYTGLDAWLPISFCSLFIYATWLSGYARGVLKKIGEAYIVIGSLLGGLGFLLIPTTSLMRYPIWHFLCLYSLLFHMLMIYLGVMYIGHRRIPLNRTTYFYFSFFFIVAAIICIILNSVYGSNLMILREPFNVPFLFVHQLKAKSQVAYTLLATLAYLIGPGVFAFLASIYFKRQQLKES